MSALNKRLGGAIPLLVGLAFANAALWAIEGLSGSYNPVLAVFFVLLNLIGAWAIWAQWHKPENHGH